MAQAPIKVSEETRELVRYLSRFSDKTQGEVVGEAVEEYVSRHPELIRSGFDRAREVLSSGNAAIASYLLDENLEDVRRISGMGD